MVNVSGNRKSGYQLPWFEQGKIVVAIHLGQVFPGCPGFVSCKWSANSSPPVRKGLSENDFNLARDPRHIDIQRIVFFQRLFKSERAIYLSLGASGILLKLYS